MSFKLILLCAQALLIQSISSQFIGNGCGENLAYASYAPYGAASYSPYGAASYAAGSYAPASYAPSASYNPAMLSASNGGGLAVASSSPFAPTGVSMTSENAFEGPLAVAGQIPFLGAVGVEGALPTAGAGTVSYGSGNGNVAMLAEDLGYGYGSLAPGYGAMASTGYAPASYAPYASYGACY